MAFRAGDTFRSAYPSVDSHLWVILSDPEKHPDDPILIANLTSWGPDRDETCVLHSGDHPFVSRRTCVNYRQSRLVHPEKLEEVKASGAVILCQRMTRPILRKIREGATVSAFTPFDNVELLRTQGLVE